MITYGDDVLGTRVFKLPGNLLRLVGGVEGGNGEASPGTPKER